MSLEILRPAKKLRVIDLAAKAGTDVSDWGNFKGGVAKASVNPKYCYEWAFVQPSKVVVLNLWYASMDDADGEVSVVGNFRVNAEQHKRNKNTVWQGRARRMDEALQRTLHESLPLRVIICDGWRRGIEKPEDVASKVRARKLDESVWRIASYDPVTGAYKLVRGSMAGAFVDQFVLSEEKESLPEKRTSNGFAYVRSAEIRKSALIRSAGKCEWCGQPGFKMSDGRLFLETHHLEPLGLGGPDSIENVVALCANHHREAHYGATGHLIKNELATKLKKLRLGSRPSAE